jgi:hypothetical protein
MNVIIVKMIMILQVAVLLLFVGIIIYIVNYMPNDHHVIDDPNEHAIDYRRIYDIT